MGKDAPGKGKGGAGSSKPSSIKWSTPLKDSNKSKTGKVQISEPSSAKNESGPPDVRKMSNYNPNLNPMRIPEPPIETSKEVEKRGSTGSLGLDEDANPITKTLMQRRMHVFTQKETSKKSSKHKTKHFPCCCCKISLSVGVKVLCVIDLIYSLLFLIMWGTFIGMDFFSTNKHLNAPNTEGLKKADPTFIPEYIDPNKIMTTTAVIRWTLRNPTTGDEDENDDKDAMAKNYSNIARMTHTHHATVEKGCHKQYLIKYLLHDSLNRTKAIWDETLWYCITSELMFVILAAFLLMCVCCFIDHRGTKVFVMIVWYLQWIPIFFTLEATILSQTQRLCILQYGWADYGFKGQLFLLVVLLSRSFLYKPYELLVIFFYVKDLVSSGYLIDTNVKPPPSEGNETAESIYSRAYFADFYQQERSRGGKVDGLMANQASISMRYDRLDPDEVDATQAIVTGQTRDDPFSIRNMDIHAMQATGQVDHAMKSIRRL